VDLEEDDEATRGDANPSAAGQTAPVSEAPRSSRQPFSLHRSLESLTDDQLKRHLDIANVSHRGAHTHPQLVRLARRTFTPTTWMSTAPRDLRAHLDEAGVDHTGVWSPIELVALARRILA
jgi:hypothetical protein